jgi:type II secretory pathway predicted ATPase ExeA
MSSRATVAPQHKQRLKAHFGFTKIPFRKNLSAAHMFDSRSQRELHAGLMMWTEIRGIALVTGTSGVGKSISLRRFVADLDESRICVVKFSHLPTTPAGLLRSLCRQLGLPLRHHTADLFDAARTYLNTYQQDRGPHPLLLLDDAEGLSVAAFDVLRRLTAYELDADDRFSLLLSGTDDVLHTLQHHDLEPLRSRISYPQPLRPFSLEDTRNYIRYHLQRADVDKNLITDNAAARIFHASLGKPRSINQLSLFCLIQAAVAGIETIDGDFATAQIAAHPLFQNYREA